MRQASLWQMDIVVERFACPSSSNACLYVLSAPGAARRIPAWEPNRFPPGLRAFRALRFFFFFFPSEMGGAAPGSFVVGLVHP